MSDRYHAELIFGKSAFTLAETAMLRIKRLFSDKLKNQTFATQEVEAYLHVEAMNKMTGFNIPESYSIL